MKTGIHPKYQDITITCACGNSFVAGSVKPKIDVEICAKCHPFFTGEMRFLDTMGRVEKFKKQMAGAPTGAASLSKKARKQLKKKLEDAEDAAKPKNLKEMFDKVRNQI
jgi:large subunit ribosomal protein L31